MDSSWLSCWCVLQRSACSRNASPWWDRYWAVPYPSLSLFYFWAEDSAPAGTRTKSSNLSGLATSSDTLGPTSYRAVSLSYFLSTSTLATFSSGWSNTSTLVLATGGVTLCLVLYFTMAYRMQVIRNFIDSSLVGELPLTYLGKALLLPLVVCFHHLGFSSPELILINLQV